MEMEEELNSLIDQLPLWEDIRWDFHKRPLRNGARGVLRWLRQYP